MFSALNSQSAEIEYHGVSGDSLGCRTAVFRLVQYGTRITDAHILTSGKFHCVLLSIDSGDPVAIRSGFASGYNGLGPTTFSEVLGVLHAVGANIDEYEVDSEVIKRIDKAALTAEDMRTIYSSHAIRPQRWPDYVLNDHWTDNEIHAQWHRFPCVIPFAVIDGRIMDLAVSFWEGPDDKLMKGFRRLEGIVRKRAGSEEYGLKLFQNAFSPDRGKLRWEHVQRPERTAKLDLMKGMFGSYRNVRAHRESGNDSRASLLAEFLLLNHLYRLESEAVDVGEESDNGAHHSVRSPALDQGG